MTLCRYTVIVVGLNEVGLKNNFTGKQFGYRIT